MADDCNCFLVYFFNSSVLLANFADLVEDFGVGRGVGRVGGEADLDFREECLDLDFCDAGGETGAGVTLGTAGIEIKRGSEPDFQLIFNETGEELQAGINGA